VLGVGEKGEKAKREKGEKEKNGEWKRVIAPFTPSPFRPFRLFAYRPFPDSRL